MSTWEPMPRKPEDLERVKETIRAFDEWLIVTHERPDGDAIGSALAMACILESLNKSWVVALAEPMPTRFRYLPLSEKAIIVDSSFHRQFDNVIAVDCADTKRFDSVAFCISDEAVMVNIDHHQTNPRFGRAALVDETAAATCELIFHVAKSLNAPVTKDLATCLYTGILTDTAGFAQPNTTREVHLVTAELLASGVRPYDVAEPALEARTWEQMHLLQMALANLAVSDDGQYAALYVTRGMLEGAGATDDDVEGLVSFARSIDTVEVGLLFRETPDGKVKVSLRSKRRVDVSQIAQLFGGGGHVRAAGCVIEADLSHAMDLVVERVEEALGSA